jgi:hypothetical protein
MAAEGFNKHIAMEDRKVDALSTFVTHRYKQEIRRRLPFGDRTDNGPVANAFAHLPARQQLRALAGIVRSQMPNHKPADEKLPALAGEWFDRYDAGYDVTNWYTAGAKEADV